MNGCFQNTTNNSIESINAKLKSVITKNSKLEVFAFLFLIFFRHLRASVKNKDLRQLDRKC